MRIISSLFIMLTLGILLLLAAHFLENKSPDDSGRVMHWELSSTVNNAPIRVLGNDNSPQELVLHEDLRGERDLGGTL